MRFVIALLMPFLCFGAPYKVAVMWEGLGEYELAKRIEKASKNLGWDVMTLYGGNNPSDIEKTVLGDFLPKEELSHLVERFSPDFVLYLKPQKNVTQNCPNYLVVTGCDIHQFDEQFIGNPTYLQYDAILHSSPKINRMKEFFWSSMRPFNAVPWFVSCPATIYQPIKHDKIFYCGFQWDWKRTGLEYMKMYSLLDRTDYFVVYGPDKSWEIAPRSRKGNLPFGGNHIHNAIREAGVTLVLHAQSHIDLGAPSSRVFEGASACSVIISDRNPFIVENFGDAILYVDDKVSGEEMFAQIDRHMQWIKSHPIEAEALARRAHAIFLTKFTLEGQLQNLVKMHERVVQQKSDLARVAKGNGRGGI